MVVDCFCVRYVPALEVSGVEEVWKVDRGKERKDEEEVDE